VKDAIQSPYVARFESFEVNLRSGELLKNGERIKMPEQSFQILAMLLERPGGVVMRQEIQKRLWPNDTVVEFENSINAAIKRLRTALGDSADGPTYIETLARRGYRWKIPVEWVEPTPAQPVASQLTDYSASRLIGKRVSHYRVLELVGGGGMGLVYKAEDIKLGRRVALKFLPEELAGGAAALQRFEREARAASALNDPNICTIYEIEEHEGQPFIVMELLEGQTLRELISMAGSSQDKNANTFSPQKLLDIGTQIASGLGAAHNKGIVHRDIKPANIFVTTNGQIKILDFGLAKLQHAEAEEVEPPHSEGPRSELKWNPHTSLTRTGVTIGTAGYMSPEQIRGEKLDARTDLFSFGLVLYEMTTGQRAFTGDTAPVLENVILHQDPTPVRELNRAIPPKLEAIVNKALEKEREKRYQSASEIRADLEMIKREVAPRSPFRRWIYATLAIALLLIGSAIFWFVKYGPLSSQARPDVKLTQLTDNSPENPVGGGYISPDGKYLAYTDRHGMHIKLVGSDDAQSVPQPVEFNTENLVWEIGAWFPDSKRFLVHSHPAPVSGDEWFSASVSTWVVSALGGAPQKLRDGAYAWDVSPDGSTIAFGANFSTTRGGTDETWLMSSDGQDARRLLPRGEICCMQFFPDGKRILYESGDAVVASDLAGGPVTTLLSVSDKKRLGEIAHIWLPDGTLIYFDPCNYLDLLRADKRCNFWITRVDMRRGGIVETPRRLTNWVGIAVGSPSETANRKRLAFLQSSSRGVGYLADLAPGGTRVIGSRRFPLEEGGEDSISSWTADGKSAIVTSVRSDHYTLRMQALNSDAQEPIVPSAAGRGVQASSVSPDGKWVVFLSPPADNVTVNTTVQLMRVPVSGGSPEAIFSMRGGSSFSCARRPANLCAVGEETQDRKTMIVTAFDPLKGKGNELARFELDNPPDIGVEVEHLLLWDISPDGTHLAVSPGESGPIAIHSLQGKHSFAIPQKETSQSLKSIKAMLWAANGKGLIVSTNANQGGEIFHLDLQGNAHSLWKCASWCIGLPSPDGRHLGIYNQNVSANMWMMENF
jgi:serine/threonine protein kinase